MRNFQMLPVAECLPGILGPKTYAPWKVWSGSTTKPVRFLPTCRKEAARLYNQAKELERQTREPGKQDGVIGRNGLKVLEVLVFDCLDYKTGRLDPCYVTIARKGCMSIRSVARGLKALWNAKVLTWVRRCKESIKDGRFTLEQESNAYGLCPTSQWHGFAARPEAPAPEAGTWGDHPCGARDALTEAATEVQQGSGLVSVVQQLEADPTNKLAAVLARLGRSMAAKTAAPDAETLVILRSASLTKNLPQNLSS